MQRDALDVADLVESSRNVRGYLDGVSRSGGTKTRCCVTRSHRLPQDVLGRFGCWCVRRTARCEDQLGSGGREADRLLRAPPPADPSLVPLTVHEIQRLLATAISRPQRRGTPPAGSPGAAATGPDLAGSTSARLARNYSLAS